jgi:NAD(P)-dependent dehydrogenase (short-subunit alcohol dehydrogenase family)
MGSSSRVVLLTGASGGLGEPLAADLIEHGFVVVGVARSLKRAAGGGFVPLEADLTAEGAAKDVVARAVEKAGAIDAVVHALGGFAGGTPIEETDLATWRKMIDLNLGAAFALLREVVPVLKKRGRGGRIVAIGSRTGVEPAAGLSAYGVSKAGLVALVRTVALEVAASGITANVILPSVIDTPQNRAADPGANPAAWVTPGAIASLVRWLISEEARDVNGAALPMYGGA